MGSEGDEMLAADVRLEVWPQRRVCEMRRVVMSGWPTVAMRVGVVGLWMVRLAVCRMWVWGIETVIIMRRGGRGDGGARGERLVFVTVGFLERRMVLCC